MLGNCAVMSDAAAADRSVDAAAELAQFAEELRELRRRRRDSAGPLGGPGWRIGRSPLPPERWTQQRVLDAIRAWAAETGSPPICEDWRSERRGPPTAAHAKWECERPRWPSVTTVRSYCGSWSGALEQAGFPAPPALEGTCRERIQAAQRMAGEGHGVAFIAEQLGVTRTTVQRYLRPDYCRACGSPVVLSGTGFCGNCFRAAQSTPLYGRQVIIERLREWHAQHGHAPAAGEWQIINPAAPNRYQRDFPYWPSHGMVVRVFGSWHAAVRAAGLEPVRERWSWSRAEIIQALQAGNTRLGRTPTQNDIDSHAGLPDSKSVRRHFASWHDALNAAGLTPHAPPARTWDHASIIAALQDFDAEHGHPPRRRDFDRHQGRYPHGGVVARYFGSWNAGLHAAGLPILRQARPPWERDRIIAALQRHTAEHRRPPQRNDLERLGADEHYPSYRTICRYFDSLDAALKAAGCTVSHCSGPEPGPPPL